MSTTKLRSGERCPLHNRRDCCGRADLPKEPKRRSHGIWTQVSMGILRAADGREKCSKAEMRRRKHHLLKTNPICEACGQRLTEYSDAELSHREGKGAGGGKINDAWPNLMLLHTTANRAQGSLDFTIYMSSYWKPSHCNQNFKGEN